VLIATAKAPIVAFALLLSLLTSIVQCAQDFHTIEISVVGAPNAICTLSQALYIFGYENSTGYPRINAVVVDTVSKAITKAFTGSFGGFYSCVTHGGRIYVVGVANRSRSSTSWLIAVFDEELNIIVNTSQPLSQGVDVATDVTVLSGSLFIVGVVNKSGFSWIRVERRALDTLALESAYSVPIGLSRHVVTRITSFGNSVVLGYTVDDATHIVFLSQDLKLLSETRLGYKLRLLSLATDGECLYLGAAEGVAKVCNGIVKAFHYANGGSAISVKPLNNTITALILTPNASGFAVAELRYLDKELRLLLREGLGNGYRYQQYVKPLEATDNRIFIAMAERSWLVKSVDTAAQCVHEEGGEAIRVSVEVVVLIVYISTTVTAIYFSGAWKRIRCKAS